MKLYGDFLEPPFVERLDKIRQSGNSYIWIVEAVLEKLKKEGF